jgi:CelD/BcsL family acetyltransferase involved in cellulose biosynthesis
MESADQGACPILPLASGGEALNSLTPRQRRNLNLARNRARRRGGMRFMRAGPQEVIAFLSELERLHRARWQSRGLHGVLADPRVSAFHNEAAPLLHAAGLAQLHLGLLQERPVAAAYVLAAGRRRMLYLTGFDPEHAFESPSLLLLAHVIQECAREGADEFDFLRGRESYKLEWNPTVRVNTRRSFLRDGAHV